MLICFVVLYTSQEETITHSMNNCWPQNFLRSLTGLKRVTLVHYFILSYLVRVTVYIVEVSDYKLLILLPGSTISSSDFADILRRSSHLPPKLPSRPPTLRLNPADSQSSKVHTRPALSVYSGGHTDIDAYNNEQIRLSASEGKTVNTNAAFVPEAPVSEAQPVERLRRTEYVDKPVKSTSAAHTVKLPTRDTGSRSILKK